MCFLRFARTDETCVSANRALALPYVNRAGMRHETMVCPQLHSTAVASLSNARRGDGCHRRRSGAIVCRR